MILGCGLGYEVKAIKQNYPKADILCVFYEKTLYKNSGHTNKIFYSYEDFEKVFIPRIKQFISSVPPSDIALLQWPTSLKIWPTEITQNLIIIKEILSLHAAEKNTASFFMRQWLVNAVFHYLHIDTSHIPTCTIKKDVIVIGAGSTLTQYIPHIKKRRSDFIIISVSSALMCLYEYDVTPDIVVHQDSGYFSALHLFPLHVNKSDVKIAVPFNTSRHTLFTNNKDNKQNNSFNNIILLNSGQEIEYLLDCAGEACIPVGAYGTVIGTAIDLAWKISTGNVYLAGFDVSIDIYGAHCHPHISNNIHSVGTRTNPFEHITRQQYTTANPIKNKEKIYRYNMFIKQNPTLEMYNNWFSAWKHPNKDRTFILEKEKNTHLLMGLKPVSSLPKITKTSYKEIVKYKKILRLPYTTRREKINKKIHQWENIFKYITTHQNKNTNEETLHRKIRLTFGSMNKKNASTTFEQLYNLVNKN